MNWLQFLYKDFFMRDILGKITPGAIELFSLSQIFGLSKFISLEDIQWPIWILLTAFAFVTGLAFQKLGEWIGIHSACPRPHHLMMFPAPQKWREHHDDFKNRLSMTVLASKNQWSENAGIQRERFLYLKEGAGNNGIAMLMLSLVLLLAADYKASGGVFGLAVLFLIVHFIVGSRQADHEIRTLYRGAIEEKDLKLLERMAVRLDIRLEK